MKVLFLGSSRFSRIVLERMLEEGIDVCGVVTQPDRPSGRGHKLTPTEVKTFAESKGMAVYTFEKIRLAMDEVKTIDFDLSVVASFGQILPQEFLDFKPCINVHPSLLPKYRGASPIQSAILNGDNISGVTIMKVAMEVDAGDIISQQECQIKGESYLKLEEKFALLGGKMAGEVVRQYEKGQVQSVEQDHQQATFTNKFSKADCALDFEVDAQTLVNKVRAFGEENGCQTMIDGQVFKIREVLDVSNEFEVSPCQILNNKKRFVVGCKNGAVEILLITPPSGKTVSGRDYLNGHNDILGRNVEKCLQI